MDTPAPSKRTWDWDCRAYGPDLPDRCFFHSADGHCNTLDECTARMATTRRHLYRQIQQFAAEGDPVFTDLADTFHSPDTLLNPDQHPPE